MKLSALHGVSVIIPVLNGAKVLANTLDDVQGWLEAQQIPHEVIVVDDGSTDATATVVTARGRNVRVLVNDVNRGKGHAVRRGMLAASMPWRVFMDADNATRITNVLAADAGAAEGADVIIASRRHSDATLLRSQPLIRRITGGAAPMVTRLIALPGIADTQCGFKVFKAEAAEDIFARAIVDRFMFDVEVLLLARRLGYSIREFGVAWDNPSESTLSVRRDMPQMVGDLLRTSLRLRIGGVPAPRPYANEKAAPEPAAPLAELSRS